MSFKSLYLGKTAQGTHLYVEIKLERRHLSEIPYTDHEMRPAPETLSIIGSEFDRQVKSPLNAPDRYWISGGQNLDRLDDLTEHATPHTDFIKKMWKEWHCNTLNAACDHMTEEMLTPTEETLKVYAEKNPRVGSYNRLSYWRSRSVTCPETGYKYGSAWLAKAIPAEELDQLTAIIEGK